MVGDREQAAAGHPQQAIRLVYRLLDGIQSSSQAQGGGDGAATMGVDGADAVAAGDAAARHLEVLGGQVHGALKFLEERYWDWLRHEWLPSIQASTDSARQPLIRNETLAVDLVRAWVQWFLGTKPHHAQWENSHQPGSEPTPLWAQVFFLLRTGHYEEAVGMAERYSQHTYIKRALRAWIMSDGMHRIGLVDTDGDGLLDDRLALQLHTDLYQHVVSSSDMWMRAVYRMLNEGLSLPGGAGVGAADAWGGDGGKDDVGLRELPSLYGLSLPALRKLTPSMVHDTRSRPWEMLWCHVQDLAWRHLVFVRPDAPSPPFALAAIQAELAGLLALDDDSPMGSVGMDGEMPRAVLRKAPYIKVMGELLSLRMHRALTAMQSVALSKPPAMPSGLHPLDPRLEALHMSLALELQQVSPAHAAGGAADEASHRQGATAGILSLSARIEERILSRVPLARAHGPQALRAAVERAVDYALAVPQRHDQIALLAKLIILTETETDMIQVSLSASACSCA